MPGGRVQPGDGSTMREMSDAPSPTPSAASDPSSQPAAKPEITIDDFLKLDLRIATVKDCVPHPNADKLLVLQLDDGTPEGRQVCAGLRGIYQPEQFVGRQIVIVGNLAPRKMRGEISQGMLLAASNADRTQVIFLTPEAPIAPGSVVG